MAYGMNLSGELFMEPLIPTWWWVPFRVRCDAFKERLFGPFLLHNQLNMNIISVQPCIDTVGRGEEERHKTCSLL